MYIFDVGAGNGARCAEWLETFKDCLVYAFEPDPRQFAQLQQTYNKLDPKQQRRFKIFNVAVWNETCTKPFYIANDISSSSLFPFNENNITRWLYPPGRHYFKTIDTIQIQCIKLDTILQQDRIEVIDFLRIDAQGAAKQILQGIDNKRLMRIKECYIKCNISDLEIYKGQSYKEDVDRILLKYYFKVTEHETYSRGQEIWARYVSDSWKKSMGTKIYGLK